MNVVSVMMPTIGTQCTQCDAKLYSVPYRIMYTMHKCTQKKKQSFVRTNVCCVQKKSCNKLITFKYRRIKFSPFYTYSLHAIYYITVYSQSTRLLYIWFTVHT